MKKALLVVSFGTTYTETIEKTIVPIERDLQAAFPDRVFYRAWTSARIRKKLRETAGLCIDSVEEALERMRSDGVEDVLVQTTLLLRGGETAGVGELLPAFEGAFARVALGVPLLDSEADCIRLVRTLEKLFGHISDRDMLVLMGHGSACVEPNPFDTMNRILHADGYDHFCVGTVEHLPGLEPALQRARERRPERVFLAPLLIVAGEHALKDMVGEDEHTWQSRFGREGFETVPILKGMGEYPELRALITAHAAEAEQVEA